MGEPWFPQPEFFYDLDIDVDLKDSYHYWNFIGCGSWIMVVENLDQ